MFIEFLWVKLKKKKVEMNQNGLYPHSEALFSP